MKPQRTTIYIVPRVYARLEAYKAYINISAVCTRALEVEMDRLDAELDAGGLSLEKIMASLGKLKAASR
jgi:hypothetical protein